MEKYGSDKPDRRYGMEMVDVTNYFKNSDFKIVKDVLDKGGTVKGFKANVPMSRKIADEYSEFVKGYGLGGVLWFKVENGQITSTTAKYLENEYAAISRDYNLSEGDVFILAVHENREKLNTALGALSIK